MHEVQPGSTPAVPSIQITHEVIAEIAMYAAIQAPGVAELGGTLSAGLNHMLGRHPAVHGVRVDVEGRDVNVSLHLIVKYGVRIPDVAQRVQEQVKGQVERATGLRVKTVDIHIQGVVFGDTP